MKKSLLFILAIALFLGGCGNNEKPVEPKKNDYVERYIVVNLNSYPKVELIDLNKDGSVDAVVTIEGQVIAMIASDCNINEVLGHETPDAIIMSEELRNHLNSIKSGIEGANYELAMVAYKEKLNKWQKENK